MSRWPLFLSLLLFAVCPGCRDKQATVAQLDGPLKVRWIFKVGYQGSHGPCIVPERRQQSFLLIHGASMIKHRMACWEPRPQLAADASKSLVAYRCDTNKPWILLHVGKKRALADPRAKLGQGDRPRWEGAPTFADSALRMMQARRCNLPELFDEVEQRLGAEGMEQLLTRAASVQLCGWRPYSKYKSSWELRLRKLSAAAQQRVQARMQAALAGDDASHWLVRRVAVLTPLDDEQLRGHLARHVRRHLDALIAERTTAVKDDPSLPALHSAIIAIQRLALKDRAAAAALACHALRLRERSADLMIDALAVVTYAGARCPAVGEIAASRPLGCWASRARCPAKGGTFEGCRPGVLAPVVGRVVEEAARREGTFYDRDREASPAVVLAALQAHGPIPAWIATAAARSRYRLDQPGINERNVPSCKSKQLKSGSRCRCFWSVDSLAWVLCALDPGPLAGALDHTDCRYRVDDAKKTITVLGKR